jgi:hypothetical protein
MSSLKMDQTRLGAVQEECAKYQTRVTQFSDGFADSVAASNMAHDHAMNAGKGTHVNFGHLFVLTLSE